jgi:AcrR family transcriptional regulator
MVVSALQLFSEQGYDNTTVTQIADRAGLTKSTFFRHFPDKRDVLSAGQETLSRLLSDGIASAPDDATPLDAVAAGLDRAAQAMTPLNRELGSQLRTVIAASSELQERDALKQVGLAAAMTDALRARGCSDAVAALAAELGGLAFKEGFAAWSEAPTAAPGSGSDDAGSTQELGPLIREALDRLRSAVDQLR